MCANSEVGPRACDQAGDEIGTEGDRVVIARVQCIPGDGDSILQQGLGPLRQKRGFAVPGRRTHQNKTCTGLEGEPLNKTCAGDECVAAVAGTRSLVRMRGEARASIINLFYSNRMGLQTGATCRNLTRNLTIDR